MTRRDDLIPRSLWLQLDRPDGGWHPTRRRRIAIRLRQILRGRP